MADKKPFSPAIRGRCKSKNFLIRMRWKCVDVRIKDGIDREQAQQAMRAEDHYNACRYCQHFEPDKDQRVPPPPAPKKPVKSADAQTGTEAPETDDFLDMFG